MYKYVGIRYNVISEMKNDVFREKDFYNNLYCGGFIYNAFASYIATVISFKLSWRRNDGLDRRGQ